MKERPILMSWPMVRALLAGTKTQTRRVIKKPRWADAAFGLEEYGDGIHCIAKLSGCSSPISCPYGRPGDRLWVREAWRPYSWRPHDLTVQFFADKHIFEVTLPDTDVAESWLDRICEDAAHECQKGGVQEEDGMYVWDGEEENPIKWRPPIFMPRFVSRITLEITEVRVQRLQEISEGDALAEGVEAMSGQFAGAFFVPGAAHLVMSGTTAKDCYSRLWESINGAGSWDANPWCWCLTFRRVSDAG